MVPLPGAHRARAYIAIAQGEPEQAGNDAHDALAIAQEMCAYLRVPDALECLALLSADTGNHPVAARLFGAAKSTRERIGVVRIPALSDGLDAVQANTRNALGENDFYVAWNEGFSLSTEEAIAYAQRGRGERTRPSSG
jgi:hypothetical protein